MPRHAHFPPYIASINCNYCGGNYCISCSIVYSNEYNDLVLYCVNLQSETKPEPGLHSMLEVIHLMLVPHSDGIVTHLCLLVHTWRYMRPQVA